jgi:hypothetical protein
MNDKKTAIKLLKKIRSVAGDASLTGAMRGGSELLRKTYAQIREAAIGEKWVTDPELIPELTDDVLNENAEHMDIIGTAATLFLALLED